MADVLTKTLPSYLYLEYSDDEDLQAFVAAYNAAAQQFVDFFNDVNLPIYTGEASLVSGALLDWVGNGLYGFPRPLLSFGDASAFGAINGDYINALAINVSSVTDEDNFFSTSDDVYRRCLTWLFWKGDGKQFTVRWLKRRVERFLTGKNGVGQDINQTYRISVTFGPSAKEVQINLINSILSVRYGPLNADTLNANPINAGSTSVVTLKAFKLAPIFKAAVDAGVLSLPFSYTWVVNI